MLVKYATLLLRTKLVSGVAGFSDPKVLLSTITTVVRVAAFAGAMMAPVTRPVAASAAIAPRKTRDLVIISP